MEEMNDKEVKESCPFCGNPAENIRIKRYTNGYNKIMCSECNATFEGFYSRQEVIDKWNRRSR